MRRAKTLGRIGDQAYQVDGCRDRLNKGEAAKTTAEDGTDFAVSYSALPPRRIQQASSTLAFGRREMP
jgi:hypothetical protein